MPASTELLPAVPRALLLQAVSRALGVPLRRAARPGGARNKKLQTLVSTTTNNPPFFLSLLSLALSLFGFWLLQRAQERVASESEREEREEKK